MTAHVAVCVTTAFRPKMLSRCLNSIICALQSSLQPVTVIVVDNDPAGSARQVVETYYDSISLIYEQESREGIPFGRNRCLAIASKVGAHFIVFVDDDMTVSPQWFQELFFSILDTDADVVTGDVINVFPDGRETPKYLPRVGDRKTAETDNVIFKSWLAERLQFDERLSLSGGSDTLFFRQACQLGAKIRHSEAAVAYEHLHGGRGSRKWFLGRNYRYGLVGVRVDRLLGSKGVSIRYLSRGLFAVAFGLVEAILAAPRADPTRSFGVYRAARGIGMLMGALGKTANRYL